MPINGLNCRLLSAILFNGYVAKRIPILKGKGKMEDKLSYEVHKEEMDRLKYSHEGEVTRLEKHNKRLWIALIISVLIIAGFGVYEMTIEDIVVTENTQDGEGINIIGGGDVNYGSETDSN